MITSKPMLTCRLFVNTSLLLIAAMVSINQTLLTAFAEADEQKKYPESVGIVRNNIPTPSRQGYSSHMNTVVEKDNRRYARGIFVDIATREKVQYIMRFPDITYRDIVPMFNGAYILLSLGDPESPSAVLFRLPTGEHKLPETAVVGKGEFVFALGLGGGGRLQGRGFGAFPDPDAKPEKPKVIVETEAYQYLQDGTQVDVPKRVYSVGLNDEFQLGDVVYKVANIVPPDRRARVIGWFEISKKDKEKDQLDEK